MKTTHALLPLLTLLAPLSAQDLPSTDIPTLPTGEPEVDALRGEAQSYWNQVAAALLERRPASAVLARDPADEAMHQQLKQVRLPGWVTEDEESLEAIVQMFTAHTGVPILIDYRAENACYDEGIVFNVNWSHPARLDQALDTLCELAGYDVEWTVKEGVPLVTVKDRARDPVLHMHMVGDLMGLFEIEDLAVMLMEQVHPGSWDEDGVSIEPTGPFVLVHHDREVQLEIESFFSDLRNFAVTLDQPPTFAATEREKEVIAQYERLDAFRFAPTFDGVQIGEIAQRLQALTGMNFQVSTMIYDELDEEAMTFTLRLEEIGVRSLLDLLVELRPELAWSIKNGVVHIHTEYEGRQDLVFSLYDVREIIQPAPSSRFNLPANAYDPEHSFESQIVGPALLEDLIRNSISPASWDMDPANSLRISENGIMFVQQSVAVQEDIRDLLRDMQEIVDVLREVQSHHLQKEGR